MVAGALTLSCRGELTIGLVGGGFVEATG